MEQSYKDKSNAIIALFAYLVGMFLVGSMVLSVLIVFIAKINDLSYDAVLKAMNEVSDVRSVNEAAALANGLGNFIIYSILTIAIVFILRKCLIDDYKNKVKTNIKRFIFWAVINSIIFYIVAYISGLKSESSENQMVIENIFNYGYGFFMFIASVFLAPIVEELIYRKVIFTLLDKYHVAIPIIVSTVFFMLPHMLETSSSVSKWLLTSLPYLVAGLGLSIIYVKSNKNIYMVMFVHFINNLIACILILI